MEIIPVMDILNGIVVHAIRGKRSEYQPLKSVLCTSSEPLDVALAFKNLGFKTVYVADLDAIMGKADNLAILQQIVKKTGLELMVDAGVTDFAKAEHLFSCGVAKVVIGTETLTTFDFVKEAIECFGNKRTIVSLDLQAGKALSKSDLLRSLSALELTSKLQNLGVCELIVLDLARVGSTKGIDFYFLEKILSVFKSHLIVGGGVRGVSDLFALKDMGVYGVLLATALHSGTILVDVLRHYGLVAVHN